MAFIKPGEPITAKISNEDLSASFKFDKFNTAEVGEEPVIVKALRCDFTIASDSTEDQSVGFQLTDALTAAQITTLKGLLAKCRDFALPLAGFIES